MYFAWNDLLLCHVFYDSVSSVALKFFVSLFELQEYCCILPLFCKTQLNFACIK